MVALLDLSRATLPEKAVARVLTKLGEPFEYQTSFMGGRMVKGGSVGDFVLWQYRLILRVQGEYWHQLPGAKERDMLQKIALTTLGWTVIDLMESDIYSNAEHFVRDALRGVSHSREL